MGSKQTKNEADVEAGGKPGENSKGKPKKPPKKKGSGCCGCCRKKKPKEKEEVKGKSCCRAGVCRCWYCCSNFFLLPLFWLISLAILTHSAYYAVMHLLESRFYIWTQLFFWSVVGTSFFLLLLVQVTYIVVLFDLKYKCGKLSFWILFILTIICIGTTVTCINVMKNMPLPSSSALKALKSGKPPPKGTGKTLTEGTPELKPDDEAQTIDQHKANGKKTDDESDKVIERRKRQTEYEKVGESSVKERKRRDSKSGSSGSGKGKSKPDFFDDLYLLFKLRYIDLLKHPNPLMPILYTILMAIILTFVLHIYYYYCCKSNGEKETALGLACERSGTSGVDSFATNPSSTTKRASTIQNDDIENANLSPVNSSHSHHHQDSQALLSKKYSWSPPVSTPASTQNQTTTIPKKKNKIKVFYFKL